MKTSPPERFDALAGDRKVCGIRVRLTEEKTGIERTIWMAVEARHSGHLSPREDVFLPTLTNYAMVLREDLDLGGMATEPQFLKNTRLAARQYCSWYPKLRLPVVSNTREATAGPRPDGVAAFCSGGVDGLFSVLGHTGPGAGREARFTERALDHVYHVLYSEKIEGIFGHGDAGRDLAGAIAGWGAEFIPVYSNIYLFSPLQKQNYRMVGHGAAFASLAHSLSRSTGVTLLGSSHTYGLLCPYGSTPELDPLFSSSGMTFVNDGAHFSRMEKVEFLSRYDAALRVLNVCDHRAPGGDYVNCSTCHKCLRTMIAFDLCGRTKAACPAFDWQDYSPASFGRLQIRGSGVGGEDDFAVEIRDAAIGRRPDIAAAAAQAIARSKWFKPLFVIEDFAKDLPIDPVMRQSLKGLKKQVLSLLGASR